MLTGFGNSNWTDMNLSEEMRAIPSNRKILREFGLLVGGVFLVLGALLYWKGRAWAVWMAAPGFLLFLAGLAMPEILRVVHRYWMTLALLIGWVVTRILLTVLYFTTVTPIGIFLKLTGKDLLDEKIEGNPETYWRPCSSRDDAKKYEFQF